MPESIREKRAACIKKLLSAVCGATGKPVTATPALDTDCLLSWILDKPRAWLIAHDDTLLPPAECSRLDEAVSQRLSGLPVAYITGHRSFYGHDFTVTPGVLIPKPDTELLVEQALLVSAQLAHSRAPAAFTVADICTGSGCVAVSLLAALAEHPDTKALLPRTKMFASDISAEALAVARKNATAILEDTVRGHLVFLQGDLFAPFFKCCRENSFDMIVSNPPYVPAAVADMLLADGRAEPRLALDGDAGSGSSDGLGIIRRLIPQAYTYVKPGGCLLLETGEYNAAATASLLEAAGFSAVQTFPDLSGQPRVTLAWKSPFAVIADAFSS